MRLLHAAGFSASERESYRVIVFSNIFSIMQTLLEIVQQLDIEIHDKQLQVPCDTTCTINKGSQDIPSNHSRKTHGVTFEKCHHWLKMSLFLLIISISLRNFGRMKEYRVRMNMEIHLLFMIMFRSKSQLLVMVM